MSPDVNTPLLNPYMNPRAAKNTDGCQPHCRLLGISCITAHLMSKSSNNNAAFSSIADVHNRVCSWVIRGQRKLQRRLKNGKEAPNIYLLCGVSALVFLLWNSYNSWIWISKSASLGCFHVASGMLESWTKRLFISTRDNCSEQLTYARIVSHPLGTHSFSRHTFSCLLRGFLFPLESFAILSLHTFVRTLEELTRQEAEELDPHEHAVLSNPAKILACEFYSRTYRSASTHWIQCWNDEKLKKTSCVIMVSCPDQIQLQVYLPIMYWDTPP